MCRSEPPLPPRPTHPVTGIIAPKVQTLFLKIASGKEKKPNFPYAIEEGEGETGVFCHEIRGGGRAAGGYE